MASIYSLKTLHTSSIRWEGGFISYMCLGNVWPNMINNWPRWDESLKMYAWATMGFRNPVLTQGDKSLKKKTTVSLKSKAVKKTIPTTRCSLIQKLGTAEWIDQSEFLRPRINYAVNNSPAISAPNTDAIPQKLSTIRGRPIWGALNVLMLLVSVIGPSTWQFDITLLLLNLKESTDSLGIDEEIQADTNYKYRNIDIAPIHFVLGIDK